MRRNSSRYIHKQMLRSFAGLIAGMMVLSHVDIQEVIRFDRLQHLSVSLILFLILFWVMTEKRVSLLWPALGVLSLGLFKELTDPTFQNFDMVANFFGVALGILIIFAFPALIQVNTKQQIERSYL